MSHPLTILLPERSSWTSSGRARIRAPPRCQSGRGGYLHRGTKNWYVVWLVCVHLVLLQLSRRIPILLRDDAAESRSETHARQHTP
jgi:hypothetical protein